MAVQPDMKQDARRRADEYHRDYVATEGGATSAAMNNRAASSTVASDKADVSVSNKLLYLLEKSAQSLRYAGESVENRGLKLLLKVMAQERVYMYNALRQAMGKRADDPLDSENQPSARNLRQGLEDIQTGMTVQRAGRENVSLTHLLQEEDDLLAAYSSVLESDSATSLRELLEPQRAQIAQFDARLQAAGDGVDPIVARVFDSRIEGESAVTQLQQRGLDISQIDAAPINQVARPVLRSTAVPASPKSAIAAGAFAGAIVGGVFGLIFDAFIWFAPQLVGWVTMGPWVFLPSTIIIGAVFGVVFGFFIGQNKREYDLSATADGLVNGEYLVAAYPQPQQVAMAEDVLQIHHARELNR